MTKIASYQLFAFFIETDFDVESIIPGRDYDFIERRYVDRDGKVDTAIGTIEHVTDWNEFNEGNEDIHIVFKLNDQLFKAVLYNDSWSGDGHNPELTSLHEVEAKEVTVTRYEKVNR
jgi:hypothetical protein